jgi:hypothetical protein
MREASSTGLTDVTLLTHVSDGTSEVAVRRVDTPKGTRLELEAIDTGHRLRLDAVTLECLTWQDKETFLSFVDRNDSQDSAGRVDVQRDSSGDNISNLTSVTNEFGHVDVGVYEDATSRWLQITAPKLGFTTRLNAAALESVVWQDRKTFTELIRNRLEDSVTES